jgi:hypothetical protein
MLIDTPHSNGNTHDHAALEADLQNLAEMTGGSYAKVEDQDFQSDLEGFYGAIKNDLKDATIYETTLDASLVSVTVDDSPDVPGGEVLQYQYVPGISTEITIQTGITLPTLNEAGNWTAGKSSYPIGTMEYGQTWTANLRFAFLQIGTIGLFTDGASKIRFSNAAGTAYEQDLPPVYITVVDQETADVFGTSTLSIPALDALGNSATLNIDVDWTLDYAGEHPESVRQRAQYQYSADNIVWDNLWHDFAVPAVDEDVTGDYDAELDTDKKNGYYRIRIHAWEAISGGAEAWRTTEQPVRVDDGKKIRMKLI